MKKSLLMLLMFAVAGVAVSWEKDVAPNKPKNETSSDVQPGVSTVNGDIVGLWMLEGEINNQLGNYDNTMTAAVGDPSHPVWYKYTFDDDVLYITSAENMNATPTKKYYRFEGDKLYLSNEQGDLGIGYSTIKLE